MGVLTKTVLNGRVEALLVNKSGNVDLSTSRCERVQVDYAGFVGDNHYGLTRKSCVRVTDQYPKGTLIRNTRQISILSTDELQAIANAMAIGTIEPEWVGANMAIQGVPLFTQIPPSSRLIFGRGASLVVDMENYPCKYPGDIIDRHYPGVGKRFAGAAMGKRGVTAWVEREGEIVVGESFSVHIPPQRIYSI